MMVKAVMLKAPAVVSRQLYRRQEKLAQEDRGQGGREVFEEDEELTDITVDNG